MGRGRRICYPGAFFHCINRGDRREKIFCDEDDYDQMLKCLGEVSERYGVLIHGFCLIPNHFHILLQQQEQSVSNAMRSLGTNYATYFNRKYHKVGHVFQGRFRGILCDQQTYLLSLIRYIHLNPVRARLVERAQDWAWSSLRAYLGMSACAWLYKKDVMGVFGRQPRQRLLEFLSQEPGISRAEIYPEENSKIGRAHV
jgi:REP element-mobilizing transposase RayT